MSHVSSGIIANHPASRVSESSLQRTLFPIKVIISLIILCDIYWWFLTTYLAQEHLHFSASSTELNYPLPPCVHESPYLVKAKIWDWIADVATSICFQLVLIEFEMTAGQPHLVHAYCWVSFGLICGTHKFDDDEIFLLLCSSCWTHLKWMHLQFFWSYLSDLYYSTQKNSGRKLIGWLKRDWLRNQAFTTLIWARWHIRFWCSKVKITRVSMYACCEAYHIAINTI